MILLEIFAVTDYESELTIRKKQIWMNRLVLFLMVLDICKDKSVNLKVINKKWWTKKADEKLNLDEIQYLGANS